MAIIKKEPELRLEMEIKWIAEEDRILAGRLLDVVPVRGR